MLKYTSSLSELQKYLDARLAEYIKRKRLNEEETLQVERYYETEITLLVQQVSELPQMLKGMCFMAFLGHLAKVKKITVSNIVTHCPFICYLLGVVFYDVFEEEYGEEKLYPKGKINFGTYSVDENFYEVCKDDIKQFLEQSGHICVWEGQAVCGSDSVLDRVPSGIVVFSEETNLSEQKYEFGKLYDGQECVLEENILCSNLEGESYHFFLAQHEVWNLSKEELQIIEKYKNHEVDKITVIKVLASGVISTRYTSSLHYYDAMQNFKDNIYSREDLYQYLLKNQMNEEQALYWTDIIRKGTLGRKLRNHAISYSDYGKLYSAIGKERIDLFSNVRYIPSCWDVLEKFYRLTEKNDGRKVIAVDFDGTLSFGEWPNIGPANTELIDFLKERQQNGDKLILWTCREGEALNEAVKWCEREGLVFDAVNDNIPEMIERYGTNSRKVSCDYYIDDRAVWTNAFELIK